MAYIKTTYLKDGTVKREVVGVSGEKCLEVVAPFNRHLPAGYALTPTQEFYEDSVVTEAEKQKEEQ